jgi:hypothetical protein
MIAVVNQEFVDSIGGSLVGGDFEWLDEEVLA